MVYFKATSAVTTDIAIGSSLFSREVWCIPRAVISSIHLSPLLLICKSHCPIDTVFILVFFAKFAVCFYWLSCIYWQSARAVWNSAGTLSICVVLTIFLLIHRSHPVNKISHRH